jgi:hypothetical protein
MLRMDEFAPRLLASGVGEATLRKAGEILLKSAEKSERAIDGKLDAS